MGVSMLVNGGLLLFQRRGWALKAITKDSAVYLLLAGLFVSLSTWARWIALDNAPVGVVLALGRVNVPIILVLSPLIMGKALERVTARVWLGAVLVVIGTLVLIFY
jgi:uncharacterized membrane protein